MLIKKAHYRPVPKGAEVVTRNGQKYARWTNERGKTLTQPLNDTGDRIVCESRQWYVRLRHPTTGEFLEWKAYSDKTASQKLEMELFAKLERGQVGLTDPHEESRKKPLAAHLEDFEAYLDGKGNTRDHIDRTVQRCKTVFDKIKATTIGDITPGRVEGCLAELRRGTMSVSSSNHYLRAVRNFSHWLVNDRRVAENPIAGLKALKLSDVDKKRRRRNLSGEELTILIAVTQDSETVFRGLTGKDRSVLYALAANTGLRASELASLTPESFDLDSPTATVRCLAGYTKNGEEAFLPLRSDVTVMMRDYLSNTGHGERVWPGSWAKSRAGAAMIKADLEPARQAWIGETKDAKEKEARERSDFLKFLDASDRYADFHSLRHTFISNLARSGVHPKMAQTLARHSDINLTMNVYTHTVIGDQAAAVESLPAVTVEVEEPNALAATGTDGKLEDGARRRTKWRNFPDSPCEKGASRGEQWRSRPLKGADTRMAVTPMKSGVSSRSGKGCLAQAGLPEVGIEPTRPCGHGILNPARLPIPPLRRSGRAWGPAAMGLA